ncbi:MAG: carboxypeptidase-like regulatory domain-containing protein, partial [Planctomycetota bacterium]
MRFLAIVLLGVLLLGAALLLGPGLGRSRSGPAPEHRPVGGGPDPAPEPPKPAERVERVPADPSSGAASSPAASPTPGASLEVSGVVERYHGSQGPDPIPDARVRILHDEREVAVAHSDSRGRFELRVEGSALRIPARLLVGASKEGFLSWITGIRELEVDSLPFRRNDLRLILHERGELRGRVLETHGDVPVAGAKVEVLTETWEGTGGRRLVPRKEPVAFSDERGWFSIEKPAADVFMDFQVSAPERLSVLFRTFPPRPPPDGIHVVRLPRIEDHPLIEGTVRDAEGRPIEGASVQVGYSTREIDGALSLSEAIAGHQAWLAETGRGEESLRTVT